MKKFFAIVLTVCLLASALCVSAFAADPAADVDPHTAPRRFDVDPRANSGSLLDAFFGTTGEGFNDYANGKIVHKNRPFFEEE